MGHSKPPNQDIAQNGTTHPVRLGLACDLLLFDRRVNITRGRDAIRVGTDAQTIHVVGDLGPAVEHVRRNNNDITRPDHAVLIHFQAMI